MHKVKLIIVLLEVLTMTVTHPNHPVIHTCAIAVIHGADALSTETTVTSFAQSTATRSSHVKSRMATGADTTGIGAESNNGAVGAAAADGGMGGSEPFA